MLGWKTNPIVATNQELSPLLTTDKATSKKKSCFINFQIIIDYAETQQCVYVFVQCESFHSRIVYSYFKWNNC